MAKDAYKKAADARTPDGYRLMRRDALERAAGPVALVRIDLSLGNLLVLMLKLAVAAVPAAIIASIIWTLAAAFLGGALVTGM
jgi:hypothetical protein